MSRREHRSDYDEATTARCERVLLTLLGDLGPWRERIYLAGGLAPRYLTGWLPEGARPHVGTTDIDLVIGLALGDETPETSARTQLSMGAQRRYAWRTSCRTRCSKSWHSRIGMRTRTRTIWCSRSSTTRVVHGAQETQLQGVPWPGTSRRSRPWRSSGSGSRTTPRTHPSPTRRFLRPWPPRGGRHDSRVPARLSRAALKLSADLLISIRSS